MITRMISSKNSEIYSIVKKKVKEKKEKEELRKLELQQQDIIKSPSESKADETNDNIIQLAIIITEFVSTINKPSCSISSSALTMSS